MGMPQGPNERVGHLLVRRFDFQTISEPSSDSPCWRTFTRMPLGREVGLGTGICASRNESADGAVKFS